MITLWKKPVQVRGVTIPHRRFTVWALIYFLLFVGLPVTLIMGGLDLLLYVIFVEGLGVSCYGVQCLF